MPQNQVVQARINGEVKAQAAAVLAGMGLSVSDAVRMLLTKVAREKMLPPELFVPNETTLAAMEEAQKGGLPRVRSVSKLFEAMDADV